MKWRLVLRCKLCGKIDERTTHLGKATAIGASIIEDCINGHAIYFHHCANGDVGLAELIGVTRVREENKA